MKTKYIFLLSLTFLFACAEDSQSPVGNGGNGGSGQGGSLARFAIIDDFLYTAGESELNIFDISDPTAPELSASTFIGAGVETLFPFGNFMFFGTQTGMLIYERNPEDGNVTFISQYEHITSCDPVVTDGQTAYVTLRVTGCRTAAAGATDVLESISLDDITAPTILDFKEMNSPQGLGLDGDFLFVCDSSAGLAVFDVSDPANMLEVNRIEGITAHDVILSNGTLLVIGPDNIYQYDYTNAPELSLISQLELQ